MKIKTTLAVLGAILALSACTVETPTTLPAEATARNEDNDSVISQDEFEFSVQYLADQGVIVPFGATRTQFQAIGESSCELAAMSETQDEFGAYLSMGNAGTGFSDFEAGAISGAAMSFICPDELIRLGF